LVDLSPSLVDPRHKQSPEDIVDQVDELVNGPRERSERAIRKQRPLSVTINIGSLTTAQINELKARIAGRKSLRWVRISYDSYDNIAQIDRRYQAGTPGSAGDQAADSTPDTSEQDTTETTDRDSAPEAARSEQDTAPEAIRSEQDSTPETTEPEQDTTETIKSDRTDATDEAPAPRADRPDATTPTPDNTTHTTPDPPPQNALDKALDPPTNDERVVAAAIHSGHPRGRMPYVEELLDLVP